MKKIFISILVILLMVLTYFLVLNDIHISDWKNKNVEDIKDLNLDLNEKIELAKTMNNQEYEQAKEKIKDSIKGLEIAKEEYEDETSNISDKVQLGVVQVKEYKIERLWIALENYAKDNNIELKLDLLDTATTGIYDLDITLVGEYIGITDFIYAIEKDDTLGFKILNFKLLPNTTVTENQDIETNEESDNKNTTTVNVNVNKLKATFRIENVGIELN